MQPKSPSFVSIAVWALIGFAAGFVIGGLSMTVSGAQGAAGKVVNVRVEVLGVIVRQGVGPESMVQVIWTWGAGVLALFAFVGAGVAVGARMSAQRFSNEWRQSP